MLWHAEDYHHYQISEWDRNLIKLNYVTHPLYVSVFIDGSEKSTYLQILCVFNVCECVCLCLFVHVCRGFCVHVCVCVRAPCANMVKVGGNQIGYDLGWQVLRAIVITPVWVNHISLCVRPHTLPTWWIRSLNWIKLMRFCSPPKTSYQKWFMMYLYVSSIFYGILFLIDQICF